MKFNPLRSYKQKQGNTSALWDDDIKFQSEGRRTKLQSLQSTSEPNLVNSRFNSKQNFSEQVVPDTVRDLLRSTDFDELLSGSLKDRTLKVSLTPKLSSDKFIGHKRSNLNNIPSHSVNKASIALASSSASIASETISIKSLKI